MNDGNDDELQAVEIAEQNFTLKEALFVQEYLVDFNAKRAYISAGYKPNNAEVCASKMLQKPKVKALVEARREKKLERVALTADYVLSTIMNTVARCQQTEPVFDAKGRPTGQYKYDAAAVLKGCELLGRHLKLYTDKVEATGANGEKLFNEIRIIAGRVNMRLPE